ncbi:hypothetical protein [Sporosarcina sp. FSL K6-2383]
MKMREILYNHHELITVHGVTEGPNGDSFIDMDYQSLVSFLAVKRAVAE